MDNIPEHVLFEILLLLPIKSLLCMRSVCKSWRSRILNPYFVELHMAKTYNDYFITYNKSGLSHPLSVFNINFLDRDITYLDLPSHHSKPSYVVGSCNGLICVAYELFNKQTLNRLYIWNPATRQVKHIREYTNFKIDENMDTYDVSLGFCFDLSSGDYKVVRIVNYAEITQVEVYSLIKNYWKEIKVELNFSVNESICPAGSIYFICSTDWVIEHSRYVNALISFNVKSENFCKISLPDSIMCRGYCYSSDISLFEFNESVALIDENLLIRNEYINIWTLDDDSCWINKFTITMTPSLTKIPDGWTFFTRLSALHTKKIVGCLKTGEFVGKTCAGELFLYDPVNDVVKQTQLKFSARTTFNYSESLVNLNCQSRSLPKKGKCRGKSLPKKGKRDRASKRY